MALAVVLVSRPRTLAARCRASMSLWSRAIWVCLAAMASVISLMAGTILAELEGSQRKPVLRGSEPRLGLN